MLDVAEKTTRAPALVRAQPRIIRKLSSLRREMLVATLSHYTAFRELNMVPSSADGCCRASELAMFWLLAADPPDEDALPGPVSALLTELKSCVQGHEARAGLPPKKWTPRFRPRRPR